MIHSYEVEGTYLFHLPRVQVVLTPFKINLNTVENKLKVSVAAEMSLLPKLSRAARASTDLDAKRNFLKLKSAVQSKDER